MAMCVQGKSIQCCPKRIMPDQVPVKYGVGRHQASLTDHEQVYALKWFWVSVWLYYASLGCAKFSILFQYLRIFPQRGFRKATLILMVVVGIYTAWGILSAIFACWPVEYFWSYVVDSSRKGTCLNRLAVWVLKRRIGNLLSGPLTFHSSSMLA